MTEMRAPYHALPNPALPHAAISYLEYLSYCLYYGVWRCHQDEQATANWWAKFRRFTDEMGISEVECSGITFSDEVQAVLNPMNPGAVAWAQAHLDAGVAEIVDEEDPGSVIARLYWPAGAKRLANGH
ncbi:MAG: hypothetical protein KGQ75_14390 [Sphingomonadales bacterium]|nr:hypothetical protein [Sphingomonadales bacterium]